MIIPNDDVVCVLVGTASIVVGIFNKTFYAGRGVFAASSDKQIPRWEGRFLFILIGGMFLFFGIYDLVSKLISE